MMASWLGAVSTSQSCHFAGLAVVADRRVERGIAAEPAVHVDHVLIRYAEALAISFTWSGCRSPSSSAEILLFGLSQVEEQFFWFAVVPMFYERPRTQDVLLY
jgi:hypothetical protein